PVMMKIRFAERVFEKLGSGYQVNESDRLFVECSVAAVKARAVAEAGFFDTAFHPAYSEDCDLSLRFRHCGWRLANMSINHIHNYFAQAAKRQRLAELDVRHGDFRTRHLEMLFQRWAQPPSFERQDIRRLFPGVYFPGLPA
ncbi:MAG: hypothetical protein K2Q10_07435, partial [Rhodospirillales bacterium]|nr:hypothetical protein [Rhodospirillales bacterium]